MHLLSEWIGEETYLHTHTHTIDIRLLPFEMHAICYYSFSAFWLTLGEANCASGTATTTTTSGRWRRTGSLRSRGAGFMSGGGNVIPNSIHCPAKRSILAPQK